MSGIRYPEEFKQVVDRGHSVADVANILMSRRIVFMPGLRSTAQILRNITN